MMWAPAIEISLPGVTCITAHSPACRFLSCSGHKKSNYRSNKKHTRRRKWESLLSGTTVIDASVSGIVTVEYSETVGVLLLYALLTASK
jgi:hypothetical protein